MFQTTKPYGDALLSRALYAAAMRDAKSTAPGTADHAGAVRRARGHLKRATGIENAGAYLVPERLP